MKKWILCLLCFCSFPALTLAGFTVHGDTIQPACVGLFNQRISPYPIAIGIDIDGCQRSDLIPHMAKIDGNRVYFLYQAQGGAGSDGYYGYEVVGQAKNGVYVLHTFSQLPGSSEIYDALLFIKLSKQIVNLYVDSNRPTQEDTTKMLLQAYMPGGDRCSGGIASAKLQNDVLTIKKYPSINSVNQCEGANTITIDLSD